MKQRELTCLLWPTQPDIVADLFTAGKRTAGYEVQDDEHRPSVAAEAVSSFIADGAGAGKP